MIQTLGIRMRIRIDDLDTGRCIRIRGRIRMRIRIDDLEDTFSWVARG